MSIYLRKERYSMKVSKLCLWIFPLLFVLIFIGCNDGGSGSSSKGNFDLSLSDATTDEYNGVYVTIEEVQVHKSEGSDWKTVASLGKTYNLLELVNGVREQLCITELETGHYTQMRLIIGENPDNGLNILSERHTFGNYIIDKFDKYYELKIPSGYKTGIKIVHGFDINESQTTELILDFDVSRSIVRAGNKGKCLLSPTIKVLDTKECSLISGIVVTDIDTESAMEGVWVSAQIYDLEAADPKDSVVIQTSTITDEDGSYTIFLEPGEYNIIAYKDGYNPDCAKTVTISNTSYTQDFLLTSASTEVISGSVDIEGEDDDQYVTIAVRQALTCTGNSGEEQIETISLNIANGGNYNIRLPQGTAYNVVASTYGKETQKVDDVYPPEEVNIQF
jgi:hypothetical protein